MLVAICTTCLFEASAQWHYLPRIISKTFLQCRAWHLIKTPRHLASGAYCTFCSCPQYGHLIFFFSISAHPSLGPRPSQLRNPIFMASSCASTCALSAVAAICFALRRFHSFRIRCCSGVKFSRTFLSSSVRIATIRPKAVSGPRPDSRLANSAHFIPVGSSRDKRSPYCD